MGTQPPMLANTPDTQGEGTPSPPPAPLLEETVLRLQRAEETLNKLRNSAVERWEPEPSNFLSLARENQVEGTSLPPATNTQDEGTIISQPREEALAILGSDNIHLWNPEEEMLSPTLAGIYTSPSASPSPATVSERQHCSPGEEVAYQLHPEAATTPAAASTSPPAMVTERQHCGPEVGVAQQIQVSDTPPEEIPVPLSSTFWPLTSAQPFVPGMPWTSTMTLRADQALQPLRGGSPQMPPHLPHHHPHPSAPHLQLQPPKGCTVAWQWVWQPVNHCPRRQLWRNPSTFHHCHHLEHSHLQPGSLAHWPESPSTLRKWTRPSANHSFRSSSLSQGDG